MAGRWLDPSELRIGLGCMRLPDGREALDTIAAAAGAGITIFDTAHAYGPEASVSGHNERMLAHALKECGAAGRARIVTKGGITRVEDRWIPNGRAKAIRTDCEASLRALEGLPIDLYLIHAPDPRTPWTTSVRTLSRLLEEHLVHRIGVANVNRRQLEEALDLADIAAVQVAINPFDDRAVRGGVLELCEERGIDVIAHSPLGGPRRAGRLGRIPILSELAGARGETAPEVALAWLLDLSPVVVAIPGARRRETVLSAVRAAHALLSTNERAALAAAIGGRREQRGEVAGSAAEVVLVAGIPGAGKSRVAESFSARGFARLNRDERGGSLRELAAALDAQLGDGAGRIVLDNTYLTRAARSLVIDAAKKHHARVRCIWLDTPLDQAQINLVERMIDRYGALPGPDELRRLSREPGMLTPTSQMRTLRELEIPSTDEGFEDVERLAFSRQPRPDRTQAGVLVAAEVVMQPGWNQAIAACDPQAPHLLFKWCPDGCADELSAAAAAVSRVVSGPIDVATCPHGGGPPSCWCRPPLPGLPLAFAHTHGVDLARSTVVGTTPAHRRLASALGARYVEAAAAYQ